MGLLWVLIFAIVLQFSVLVQVTWGHGMMLDPAGRSSRWRFNSSALANYNDNQNYCGGFSVQWNQNNGKCGVCGDNYREPTPRANELYGKYGDGGVIVKTYENTYTAQVGVEITTNHLGFIYFELCNLDEFGVESEECFKMHRLKFADGSDKFYIGQTLGWISSWIVFPYDLTCKHCVMRWTYYAGNNWGFCSDGTGALGCGPQETFKSCADISIKAPADRLNFFPLTNKQSSSVR